MKRIMITGVAGFVASHFLQYLINNNLEYEVLGVDLVSPSFDVSALDKGINLKIEIADMMDEESVRKLVLDYKPNYILHLAAFSSVAYSWQHPTESFTNNCNIFLNLVNTVREIYPECRILSVGSSEEYGNVAHEDLPIRENQIKNPISPYAVARLSQELLSAIFVDSFGMDIIMTRSFNHIGPGQDERFVIPSFIKQIMRVKESGQGRGIIETGNLDIIRDFVDVRDVVDAYYLLLMKGVSGEVYNICSGTGVALRETVEIIANEIGVEIETKTNTERVRPNDNMEIVGSPYKIESELGWRRNYSFRQTIKDMIEYNLTRL